MVIIIMFILFYFIYFYNFFNILVVVWQNMGEVYGGYSLYRGVPIISAPKKKRMRLYLETFTRV